MPIYEYRCSTCGQNFDVTQRMSDDALTECTVELCVREDGKAPGGGEVSRVLFAPAIHFKGTGWYITDYSRKGQPKEGEEKAAAEEKAGSDKKAGGEEKAAGKPTKKSKASDKTKKS